MNMSPYPPTHVTIAQSSIGQRETDGANDSGFIRGLWQSLTKNWQWLRGQPWCGAFVADCLKGASLPIIEEYYRAKAWALYGNPIATHEFGCIAVLERTGGGHVAFVVGMTSQGQTLLLGGNQGNAVSIIKVNPSDVLCYRSVPDGQTKFKTPVLNEQQISQFKTKGSFA